MRRVLACITCAVAIICFNLPAMAQSTMTDKEFEDYTVKLRQKGGEAYLKSNKTEIASVIEEFQDAVSIRKKTVN